MPSLADMQDQVSYLLALIKGLKSEDFTNTEQALQAGESVLPRQKKQYEVVRQAVWQIEDQKARFETFIASNNTFLGHVFAGSGYQIFKETSTVKSPDSTILDWALVDIVPARRCKTTAIAPYGTSLPSSTIFDAAFRIAGVHTGNPSELDTVYKAGRSTKYTTGQYGQLLQAMIGRYKVNGTETIKVTMEHSITGDFSKKGDSGTLALDNKRRVVGLLFGRCQSKPVSYFTHVVDLVKNITEVTGASGVRIMGQDVIL